MSDPGRDAYRGFEYQISVTAWLALRWLELYREQSALLIEPISMQDLELLQLGSAATEEPAHPLAISGVMPGHRTIIVQVKGRSSGEWTKPLLDRILCGRSSSAQEEAEDSSPAGGPVGQLERDPQAVFLFITDGVLSAKLSGFVVDDIIFTPRPIAQGEMPGCLKGREGLAQRIGVMRQRSLSSVRMEAEAILQSTFFMSASKRTRCLEVLKARIREGLIDARKGRLEGAEIERLIAAHGGLLHGDDDSEPFAEPDILARLWQALDTRYALFLVGAPGVGKTRVARRLAFEHRKRSEPFRLIKPREPQELMELRGDSEPTLVFINDPFGQHSQDSRSQDWVTALEAFCSRVDTDLRLLVTSRAAFASCLQVRPRSLLESHRVELLPSAIDGGQLLRCHLDHSPTLDPTIRALLEEYQDGIQTCLQRAISYHYLVSHASRTPVAQMDLAMLERLVTEASAVELGRDLEETFRQQTAHLLSGLAGVWLAFEAWNQEAEELGPRIEQFGEDLWSLQAEVLGAEQLLRQHEWLSARGGSRRMHPEYIRACNRVLFALAPGVATRAIDQCLVAAIERRDLSSAMDIWRVVVACEVKVRPATRTALQTVARACVAEPADASLFLASMQFLAHHGDSSQPLDTLATALLRQKERPDRHRFLGRFLWVAPSSEETSRIAQSPLSYQVTRFWLRHAFMKQQMLCEEGGTDLAEFLYRLGDVSDDFDSLHEQLERADDFHQQVIARGVAHSRHADAERLLGEAVAIVQEVERDIDERYHQNEDQWRSNDWLSDLYWSNTSHARYLVKGLLLEKARIGDLGWVATRTEPFLFRCFRELVSRGHLPGLAAHRKDILRACPSSEKVDVFEAIVGPRGTLELGMELLVLLPAVHWSKALSWLMDAHAEPGSPEFDLFGDTIRQAARCLSDVGRAVLVFELRQEPRLRPLLHHTESEMSEECRKLLLMLDTGAGQGTDQSLVRHLLSIVKEEGAVAGLSLRRLTAIEPQVGQTIIDGWLRRSDSRLGVWALEATAGLAVELRRGWLDKATAHRHADVRKAALGWLAKDLAPESLDCILRLENDSTPSVRIEVARALSCHLTPASRLALGRLVQDRTNTADDAYDRMDLDDGPWFPGVAMAAAESLRRFPA